MEGILNHSRNEENLNVDKINGASGNLSDAGCSSSGSHHKKRGHESIDPSEDEEQKSKALKLVHEQDHLEILLNRLKEIEGEKVKLIEEFKIQESLLERERLEILTMMSVGNLDFDPMKPIHLNVGGTIITVRMGIFVNSLREPNNTIEKMFKGICPIYETPSLVFQEKVYFIDCEVSVFKIIMEWMKSGEFEIVSEQEKKQVLSACEQFGLENLKKHLSESNQQEETVAFSVQSNIVDEKLLVELFEKCVKSKNDGLIYRASRDGFRSIDFHKHCDNQGKTLTLVQSRNGHVFGGLTSHNWDSTKGFKTDPSAFIFKIDAQTISKFDIKNDSYRNAISCDTESLPSFGLDFKLSSMCNENSNSYSNFGHTYELPRGLTFESEQARKFLAGSCKFQVLEIEVYKVL